MGVARRDAAYPFKSLGNRGDAWVLHSSGHLLHNRSVTALSKEGGGGGEVCEYGEGDVVEVQVGAGGQLGFRVGGEEVRVRAVLPAGDYVLCCQPYMGGGGRLV